MPLCSLWIKGSVMSEPVDVVSVALERRAALLIEIRKLNDFLRTYAELSGLPSDSLLKSSEDALDKTKESDEPEIGLPQKEFVEAVRDILTIARRPLNSRQLLEALRRSNKLIGGSDELKNLTTKLWRARNDLTRREDGSYWLVDKPLTATFRNPDGPVTVQTPEGVAVFHNAEAALSHDRENTARILRRHVTTTDYIKTKEKDS